MRMSFNAALCSGRLACIWPFDLDLVNRPRAMTSESDYVFNLTCPWHFLGMPPMRGERHHWVYPSNPKDGTSYCRKCLCCNTEQKNQFQEEGEYGAGYHPLEKMKPRWISIGIPARHMSPAAIHERTNVGQILGCMHEAGFPKRAIRTARRLLVVKRDDQRAKTRADRAWCDNWTSHERNKFLKEFGRLCPVQFFY